MSQVCLVYTPGILSYTQVWRWQKLLAERIAAKTQPASLILLEHPPVFTFGRSGRLEHLLWDEKELAHRKVEVHWVDRGGDVTYHGPGQLVGYPLLPLGREACIASNEALIPKADYVHYLRRLEDCLRLVLQRLGVASQVIAGKTGVFIEQPGSSVPAKIASIGVKVDAHGISQHGFSLNVDPDMDNWRGIIACGLADVPPASLAQVLAPPPNMHTVIEQVVQAFGETFDYQMQIEAQPVNLPEFIV